MLFKDKNAQKPRTAMELAIGALPDLAAKWDATADERVKVKASDYDKDGRFPPLTFWRAVVDLLLSNKEPVTIEPGNCRDKGDVAFLVPYERSTPRA